MDSTTNIVSVIIPVYNSSLLLKRSIESVYIQKTNYKIELIIIDDGSEDDINQIISLYPQIKFSTQKNSGPAAARNNGLEMATGKYVSFLDADDYWKPGFLKETIHFLNNNTEAIAVSVGQIHKFPRRDDLTIPAFLKNPSSEIKQSMLLDNFYEFWSKNNHVCTGSVLMRTELVKKTKGQRVDLRITEDIEFWAYLATFGKWGFIPKILFVSDGGKITRQQGWQEKNRARWASATNMEDWESRIIQTIPDHLFTSYQKARGRIAKRLAYSMILSGRGNQAKTMVHKYGAYFPGDRMSKILKFASKSPVTWIIICNLVVIKESNRKL